MSSKKNRSNHTQITSEPPKLLTQVVDNNTEDKILIISETPKLYEYKVVVGDSAENLSETVNNHIKNGWQIFGGVSTCLETSPYHNRMILAQALVK